MFFVFLFFLSSFSCSSSVEIRSSFDLLMASSSAFLLSVDLDYSLKSSYQTTLGNSSFVLWQYYASTWGHVTVYDQIS